MRRWLFIVVPLMAAGVAVGLVVSVLTSSPVVAINTGPLGNGGNRQVACTWTTSVVNDEYTWLGNRGSSPVTVTRVGLLDPRHMVAVGRADAARFLAPGKWAKKQAAVGTVINQGQVFSLLVTVERTASSGSTAGVAVWYSSAGRAYELQAPQGITLVPAEKDCQ